MGNNDEKRLSEVLERIIGIKEELESLEDKVRSILSSASSEPESSVLENAGQAAPGIQTTEAAEAYTYPEPFTDDTPIDIIEIPNIDLPPIIEDPAAGYPLPAEAVTDGEADIPAEEPAEAETGDETDIPAEEPAEAETGDETDIPAEEPAEAETGDETDIPAEEPTEAATSGETDIPVEEPAEAPQATGISAAESDDLPFDDDLPMDTLSLEAETAEPIKKKKPKAAIIDSRKAETSVMDVMADKQAWRTDRPGSQVKNVISAISLNDRVLLINVLFREDPVLFQNTISAFNGMATLDEATDYIQANFPEWDLNSEPVYRLMMAVRRKLN